MHMDSGIFGHPSIPTTLMQLHRLQSSLAKGLHRCKICWYLDVILVSMGLETAGGIMTKLTERLPVEQTKRLSWSLGLASVSMVALGYHGDLLTRRSWWGLGYGPVLLRRFPVGDRVDEATSKHASRRHPPLHPLLAT